MSQYNPIDHVDVLGTGQDPGIPAPWRPDEVVPLEAHSAEFVRRYRAAGGGELVQLSVAGGQGHNYWPGFFRCQELIDFVIRTAKSGAQPALYNVRCQDLPDHDAMLLKPWKTIQLDPEFRGAWIVAGDLDGDGQAEVVSARNHDQDDVHYTSSVVVHRLDGSVLWRWGDASAGRNPLHHDVAAQVYDWDGDGQPEVIVAADQAVVELDGRTGHEKRRFAIPSGASDCLVFCNLTGGDRPTDVLVKTRYYADLGLQSPGELLWTADMPGGQRTAHQPRPVDLDGDGRDEIVAGYALLQHDGSVRWALDDNDAAFRAASGPLSGIWIAPPVFEGPHGVRHSPGAHLLRWRPAGTREWRRRGALEHTGLALRVD